MKQKVTFSATVNGLSASELENLMATYNCTGIDHHVTKGKRKSRVGKHNEVIRNQPYQISKSPGLKSLSGQMLLAGQAMIKLRALRDKTYPALELKAYLVRQKVAKSLAAASPLLTSLRRAGVLEVK